MTVPAHGFPNRPPLDGVTFEPSSFRDPAGRIVERDGRILRTVTARAADEFVWLRDHGLLDTLMRSGRLVATREAAPVPADVARLDGVRHVLEHQRVRFISYPYEWPFSALKAAALFHLDLHLELLEHGATLSDASAYNVQFDGTRPLFIDVLSLRRYRDDELWAGHRQFCEQFLNPLLLQTLCGVAFNHWYRGSLEGLSSTDIESILPLRYKASWRTLVHVVAPARLQRASQRGRVKTPSSAGSLKLPKRSLIALLTGLRSWIGSMTLSDDAPSGWTAYATTHTYTEEEVLAKKRFVTDFVSAVRPALLLDLGCNTGEYSAVAIGAGAQAIIGLEADPSTADVAFRQAARDGLNLLPLVVDAADPSPAQGWRGAERRAIPERASFDALLALAFVHHLAIARNVPLDQLIPWLVALAPRGVIEFVPKDDPTVQQMLRLREDLFAGYRIDRFAALLAQHARIVKQDTVSQSGRVLFWYEHGRR